MLAFSGYRRSPPTLKQIRPGMGANRSAVRRLEERCENAGIRMTDLRRVLLHGVLEVEPHATAVEIWKALSIMTNGHAPSQGSIQRNLNLLVARDILRRDVTPNRLWRYSVAPEPKVLPSVLFVEVGSLFVVFLLPVTVTPFFGRLINKIGRTRAFLLSQIIGIAGIGLTLSFHLASIVVGLALSCMAVFAGQSCATGYTAQHAKTGRSAATGLYLTCYYLGGSIGAIAPAPFYAHHGWFGCAALICLVALASTVLAQAAWQEAIPRKNEANA